MKTTTRLLLITINTIAAFIPSIAFSHPGHDVSSVTSFMHQMMHYANNNYVLFLLLVVIIFGFSVRAFLNK
ncbi:MAG: hypothetical protein AB8B92_01140 [Gammaproteobacteria bacterium]